MESAKSYEPWQCTHMHDYMGKLHTSYKVVAN
jgi:hypothetical protein